MTVTTFLRFEIKADGPFLIADPDRGDSPIDRPVHRDRDGNVFVPASSLAGSLRSYLDLELRDEVAVKRLMGGVEVKKNEEDEKGEDEKEKDFVPSRMRLLGTRVERDGNPIAASGVQRRATTAIDSARGAPKSSMLRTSEAVRSGAVIILWAEYDGKLSANQIESLAKWHPRLGSAKSTGSGRSTLVKLSHGSLDSAKPDDLMVLLGFGGPELVEKAATIEAKVRSSEPEPLIESRWRIVDGLHIGSGEVGAGEDRNLLKVLMSDGAFIIPGTTLKGVLRSRCAFIERCVRGDDSSPLTDTMFGSASRRSLIEVRDSEVSSSLICQPHVAIDRFTGGALPGALWQEQVLVDGTFNLSIFEWDTGSLDWAQHALLIAALKDLDDGVIGLGRGTTRGIGTVTMTNQSPWREQIQSALPFTNDMLTALGGGSSDA